MTVLSETRKGIGMAGATEPDDLSYSVRLCSRCGARLVQQRAFLGRIRWVCATCGKHGR